LSRKGQHSALSLGIVERASTLFPDRIAIIDGGNSFTYSKLLSSSAAVAYSLLRGQEDLKGVPVAFIAPPGFDYVAIQWGIWRAGGIAVPLPISYPQPELEYIITDSTCKIIISHPSMTDKVSQIAKQHGIRLVNYDHQGSHGADQLPLQNSVQNLPDVGLEGPAMILYTSGTTSKPKGAVITHRNIESQVTTLVNAWEWVPSDHTLLVLPLHHVHGIINVLTCALWSGAVCEIMPKFDAKATWSAIKGGKLTVFMAVPTIYSKLISEWDASPEEEQRKMTEGFSGMRLMISGSAALPVTTLEKWRAISGHTLLERYGMTEIGMAISNPVRGNRVPGCIGTPLPGVQVRLVDDTGNVIMVDELAGEIQVKGSHVFKEYWNKPDKTKEAFTEDGWFRTGDVAIREKGGIYRILGRKSVDIIKTGGYKVSALEIEEILRTHPLIEECAVVGIEDAVWGQKVCAVIILRENDKREQGRVLPGLEQSIRNWAKEKMASYKVPSAIKIVDQLPRNSLGKVVKPEVIKSF
jgi:malonyl-CoA/methylmalonyl-CoA synthetase